MSNFAGFSSVKLNKPQRSAFDLSHTKRVTARMGELFPVLVEEAVPSDSFRGSTEILVRLAPLVAPIYDQILLYVHFFFIPMRLLWEDWEEFITGGRLGVGIDPVTAPVPPHFDIGDMLAGDPGVFGKQGLPDYMGIPNLDDVDPTPANWDGLTLDLMPFVAYQLVYLEYYMDRNFTDGSDFFSQFPPLASGVHSFSDSSPYLELRRRNYQHDYFTSSLPFTQRGEEVLMPVQLGGNAPIYFEPVGAEVTATASAIAQPGAVSVGYGILNNNGPADPAIPAGASLFVKGEDFDGTSTSINDFRSAYALQVWLERNAVGGSRYTESTQAHFGVKPQDSRLNRPEYIGGGRINVQISEVLSTAWANDGSADVPQANMAGRGISYGNTNQFNYFCVEHGFILGIASIVPVPSYQQGLPRMFRRRSFLDYPWPTFAKLGEMEVHDYEIFVTPDALTEDTDGNVPLFGYQSQYADWKYHCSSNAGGFRDVLNFWTLTRVFASAPALGFVFNEIPGDVDDNIFAVPEVDGVGNYWLYIHNKISAKRPLPYFGTPNTLGFGS